MATVVSPPEQKVILYNVSWETYERMLADFSDQSVPHLTFDCGTLEIMSPSAEHEEYNRTISLLVEIIAEEKEVNIRNLGSTTFKRKDLMRGFEPDSCFYVQNEERISGKKKIDLRVDPPPDFLLEVDITSGSLDKFPIYAQLGVPEVWRYDGDALHIFHLAGGEYARAESSAAFPFLKAADITAFVEESKSAKRVRWIRRLREWVREQH